jgi:NADH dehydrogenase
MNYLVLGGTGFVGRSLVGRLISDHGAGGLSLTIPSRHPPRAKALAMMPGVTLVNADVHDDATLQRLVSSGVDAVVNLVAVLHGNEAQFQRVHVELPRRLARACHAAGVRRLVHVSALGVPEAGAPEAPSRYLASKAAGEAALHAAAGEYGLDLTVLRPSVIFGADDQFMNLFARLQLVAPVMPLAGAQARFQPVWVEDVACGLARCLSHRATLGLTFECAGPQEYRLADLVRLAGRWSGHERPIVQLPAWVGRLQAGLLSLLPGEPLMSADNLASMQVPNVASGRRPGLAELGIAQPATLASVMQGSLSGLQVPFDRFRSMAGR